MIQSGKERDLQLLASLDACWYLCASHSQESSSQRGPPSIKVTLILESWGFSLQFSSWSLKERNCEEGGGNISLVCYGVFSTKHSRRRINKEGLAGCFDAEFIAAWFVFWTLWVLLNVGGNCSPFRSTLVFRERVWKEIKAVRLPARFLPN